MISSISPMRRNFILLAFYVSLVLALSIGFPSSTFGESKITTTTPKVGNCYLLSRKDIDSLHSSVMPVNCASRHTTETFFVATWKAQRSPFEIGDQNLWEEANRLCGPQVLSATTFNYWGYFAPTKTEWAKGARWIRCDAMIVPASNSKKGQKAAEESKGLISWTGKRLGSKA